jgi:hypothetical protein
MRARTSPGTSYRPTIEAKGVRINADGFPEFEPYAMTLPNGKKRIHVELTGGRTPDEKIANQPVLVSARTTDHRWTTPGTMTPSRVT